MLKKYSDIKEIVFILNNLRDEDEAELKALWGDNWYKETLKSLKNKDILILWGFNLQHILIPIAMGGVEEMFEKNSKIACVWLLSSKFVNGNKHILTKYLKKTIEIASEKFEVLYNYIYHTNYEAKLWLKKLGFSFNNPNPEGIKIQEGFEFFYKITNRKEK